MSDMCDDNGVFSFLDSFGSKLCREELDNLQREVDSLRTRLSELQTRSINDRRALTLAPDTETSVVLFKIPAFSFPHNREARGGRIAPAVGDQETV